MYVLTHNVEGPYLWLFVCELQVHSESLIVLLPAILLTVSTAYRTVENTGKFSYLDYLEEKSLTNSLIMANGY